MINLKTGALVAALVLGATGADAANLAIFGNNQIATLYGASNTVTIVSDADLSTPGFLNAFDAFVYTRDGFSFGTTLSVAAAANVKTFVTGNIVLFVGDFQDDIGIATTDLLFNQALTFVLSGTGGGFIGEFNGALAAFSSNAQGLNPIGLVNGAAGVLGFGEGGSEGIIDVTAAGLISPVTAGVPFPYNPGAVEFGFDANGVAAAGVLARFENGNPAIVANSAALISVPEPATWAMLISGFGLVGFAARRRRLGHFAA